MAATVTSGNVSLKPTDIFRHYNGPPKPKRGQKRDQAPGRKVDPPPDTPFTDIDDILRSDLAGLGPVPGFGGDMVKGGSRDAPITIEESGSDTDSEGELPTLEELFLGRPFSNKEADVIPAAGSRNTHGSAQAPVGHQGGAVMEPITCDNVDNILTPTTMATTESGDSPHPEDGDGSGGDDNGAMGTDLRPAKQRKRTRSLSSVNTTVFDLGTPNPDPDPERLCEGPHLSKRQRLHLHTANESTSTCTPTSNPNLSRSSATGSGETCDRMDNEQPDTKSNGEAIAIGGGGSEGGDHGKTADREGSDDSGNDGGNDELLQSLEPTTQPASTLQQSPGSRRETEDEAIHELGELRNSMGGGRAVDNDDDHHGPRSLVRATARRRKTKPSRTAAPAISCAQRNAAELTDRQTPDPERQSPAAEPAPVPSPQPCPPAPSAVGKGTARLESHDDARLIQYSSPKVAEMFLAVTIQTAGDMLQMSSDEPAKLIESASAYAGKAEDVTIKPMGPAGTWQVSGRLRLRNVCGDGGPRPPAGRESTPAGGDASWDLRKRARALCDGAAYGAEVACTTGTMGDGILNDGHRRSHNSGSGDSGGDGDDDDDDYDDGYEATRRRNRRWDPVDDQRLLAWRKEEKSWKWIFDQFPDRTGPAVRVRWHMLQRFAQRAD